MCWISKWDNSHCPYPTANCSASLLLPASPGASVSSRKCKAGSEWAAAENGLSCHGERSRKMVKNNFLLTGCVDQSLCLWYLKPQQDKFGRVIEYEPINLQNTRSSRGQSGHWQISLSQIQVECIFLSPLTFEEAPAPRISVRCLHLAGSV